MVKLFMNNNVKQNSKKISKLKICKIQAYMRIKFCYMNWKSLKALLINYINKPNKK